MKYYNIDEAYKQLEHYTWIKDNMLNDLAQEQADRMIDILVNEINLYEAGQ